MAGRSVGCVCFLSSVAGSFAVAPHLANLRSEPPTCLLRSGQQEIFNWRQFALFGRQKVLQEFPTHLMEATELLADLQMLVLEVTLIFDQTTSLLFEPSLFLDAPRAREIPRA